MPSAAEAAGQQSALQAALRAGLASIDRDQTVVFQQYQKVTFSQDGFVFWAPTGQTLTVQGSLHYSSERHQEEDQTIGVDQVILSAEEEITQFNSIAPGYLWVGAWQVSLGQELVVDTGQPLVTDYALPILIPNVIQIAFSRRGSYYSQANVWHYVGNAVYPALQAQFVQSEADLPAAPIVTNSLPIWLSQNTFAPVYPSFLVPDNVKPPYVVVHVDPTQTEVIQNFPRYSWPGTTTGTGPAPLHQLTSDQLCKDLVRITLYGFNNQAAIQYLSALFDYSINTDAVGFMNRPVIRDEKRTQVEIASIAQKKTIEIEASYYQSAADAVARRLIVQASITTTIN